VADDTLGEAHEALVARLARDGRRQVGAAVIGALATDDVAARRFFHNVEIEMHEADGRIDGGRSAGGEENTG
jgi:hypothetical protein